MWARINGITYLLLLLPQLLLEVLLNWRQPEKEIVRYLLSMTYKMHIFTCIISQGRLTCADEALAWALIIDWLALDMA